ncbi:P-loop containing nucleoside triphosphate hydrolase protein [Trichoderma citrinoviride]|uniref:P-loop containing nucleoside triphosphate hydrolase protein n=1 Tax=Trichoderma citrinoviride TaxID=58853 RepID=A0A2T4B0L5_9HYPO|nr:P-loop containing nucleoside triphosphate hydrolase protein [Trichoderma citrinoviride]PTB62862.1 P-loop containing nucleoside triphosphate hydrolase protein [Trichoderma citrinoviride]
MVKKGKVKAAAPTPSQASAASKDGNGGASGKGKKGQKGQKGAAGSDAAPEAPPAAAPKPTVKQLIGGSSWTGKLPVNLLSEHCQKQKWDRPVYDTRKTAEGFSVWVTLSARDPKTQQTTTLEPFEIPATHKHLLLRDTALEAKHAAATYALFRVCSMQNKHTVLPPDYKALWKDFQALKAQDVKDGKAWMYEADPFRALLERQESKAAAEKKRREVEQAKAKARELPGAAGLVLLSNAGSGSVSNAMKGWTSVPKVEMGRQTRIQLEALLRDGVRWNPHGVTMPPAEKKSVVAELSKLGFRQSHVAEAVEYCKDRQETLEWLLIHVPEDDLPRWALPENYSAGVTIGTTDLKREGTIQRLSQTGYSVELCTRVLDDHGGNEDAAAEALQGILLPTSASGQQGAEESGGDFLDFGTPQEQWDEEVATLESIYGNSFRREGDSIIQIRLESVKDAQNGDVETFLQVRRGSSYPRHLILAIIAKLPSYIKLSIVKRMLAHIEEDLKDEPAKIYLVVDWIQHNINGIIANPGKLLDISAVSSAASETRPATSVARSKRSRPPPRALKWIFDAKSKDEWLRRQKSPAQKEMITKRQALPAWQMQDAIVQTVQRNHVTIISGETGSGKSTQSVQFLLDDFYERGLGGCANMIVTQPRRISALGLADRVAEERCSRVGGEVGYAIRGESRQSRDTRITFVTTGVLLRRLQTSGGRVDDVVASLADVSHIIIDEVHERSLDTDFLLNLLREVMIQKKDMLKLVLMSATLDAATFKSYFETEGLSVGTVEIAGRTYPVEEYHLDDVIRMTGFGVDGPDDGIFIGDEMMGKVIQKLGHRINYSLITEAVKAIDYELSYEKNTGGILIFLPGVGEINQACNSLRSISSLHVLPLHASLETREQKRVFSSPPPGKRKVVVATNVAETSITIDDIVVVIDSGKVKETSFDPQNNMRKLEETWASQAACKQRQGRAGRVQAGKCFKLYTQNLEQNMAPRPEPEIRRVPLEQLCLSVRAMGMKDVIRFLGRSPTPPATPAIEGAMTLLRRMGALDGDELTAMGQQLAMLPADLRCGKLMVFGAIFGCLDDCITIAAILSTRSPFVSPQEKRDEAREARMRFYRGDGDPLTDLEAFTQWDEMMRDRGTPQRDIRRFCEDNSLSFQTLTDIANTRSQYYDALTEIGIHTPSSQAPGARNTLLLRALVASAFTPQIARIQYPDKKFASSMSGAVELDPEARAIKYFCQEPGRVFVHPSSTLFGSQGFSGNAAYMSYFSMISTTKIFIRDLTPLNAYTLLMFCGPIELDTLGRGLLVDGWLKLRGWARLGVLVARLRAMVDNLIADKVENPGLDLAGSKIIKLVIKMIELNGLDA